MKKKLVMITGLVLLISFVYIIATLNPFAVWKSNAKKLSNSFNQISGNTATIDDLSGFIPFEWDVLCSFAPYTPEKTIYEVVGYKWDRIHTTVNEGMNQVVFLKDGKVVCYIDGYPRKYKVFFTFGEYKGNYFKLTRSDKLAFKMTVTGDGIRIFEYVKSIPN